MFIFGINVRTWWTSYEKQQWDCVNITWRFNARVYDGRTWDLEHARIREEAEKEMTSGDTLFVSNCLPRLTSYVDLNRIRTNFPGFVLLSRFCCLNNLTLLYTENLQSDVNVDLSFIKYKLSEYGIHKRPQTMKWVDRKGLKTGSLKKISSMLFIRICSCMKSHIKVIYLHVSPCRNMKHGELYPCCR